MEFEDIMKALDDKLEKIPGTVKQVLADAQKEDLEGKGFYARSLEKSPGITLALTMTGVTGTVELAKAGYRYFVAPAAPEQLQAAFRPGRGARMTFSR